MLTNDLMAKIRRIELRTRRLANDNFAGEYHSVFKGRGMEFDEVRPYQPGDEIRFIEVIGPDYEGFGPGGLLADIKQGFSTLKHLRAFKRTAVVTDKEWMVHATHALAWMIPGEVEVFGLDQLDAAKQWAAG